MVGNKRQVYLGDGFNPLFFSEFLSADLNIGRLLYTSLKQQKIWHKLQLASSLNITKQSVSVIKLEK